MDLLKRGLGRAAVYGGMFLGLAVATSYVTPRIASYSLSMNAGHMQTVEVINKRELHGTHGERFGMLRMQTLDGQIIETLDRLDVPEGDPRRYFQMEEGEHYTVNLDAFPDYTIVHVE